MKRNWTGGLLLGLALALALNLLALTYQPAHAQAGPICYGMADRIDVNDRTDGLVRLDAATAETTLIGLPGTFEVEAIAFEPGGQTLYGSDANQLGTLDLNTGAFTAMPSTYGTGSGAAGDILFDDVDGLTVDRISGVLYGTQRNSGSDALLQIDKASGAHIADAFGPGVDYVLIEGPGVLIDVDDIAVSPVTGEMFGASNTGGDGGVLINIDKATGASTVVGEFTIDDIEGLAYFTDGQLYGSTGKDGRDPTTINKLYRVNETTGVATLVAPFSQFEDYEALACLTGATTAVTMSGVGVSAADGNALDASLLLSLAMLATFTLFVMQRRNGVVTLESLRS